VSLSEPSQILQANVYTEPGNDPELSQTGIEFLLRLLPKYSQVLLSHQPPSSLEFMFMFTLKALAGSDPLPKQAAADFWVCSPFVRHSVVLILPGNLHRPSQSTRAATRINKQRHPASRSDACPSPRLQHWRPRCAKRVRQAFRSSEETGCSAGQRQILARSCSPRCHLP
jgi:hypothetical protein